MKVRQWNEKHWKFDKTKVRENNGFSWYFVLTTENRYNHANAPLGKSYVETDLGIGTMLAVEKDGIWVAWNPGWGVDIHYPPDKAPKYLRNGNSSQPCDFTGSECRSDGSSLADGEQFYPAFNRGGADAVFRLLEEWWRDDDE